MSNGRKFKNRLQPVVQIRHHYRWAATATAHEVQEAIDGLVEQISDDAEGRVAILRRRFWPADQAAGILDAAIADATGFGSDIDEGAAELRAYTALNPAGFLIAIEWNEEVTGVAYTGAD